MGGTISEIAKLAQVSTTTVSRALSEHGYVSEETRRKIVEIAARQGYTPKLYKKRQPAALVNKIIGVVVPDIRNSFFSEIIRGIESVVYQKGYDLLICDTDEDPAKEIRCISSMRSCKVCGIIIAAASDAVEYNISYLKSLNDTTIPVVFVDRNLRVSGIDSVVMDNFGGAYDATEAFIKNGHSKIAILCGPTSSKTGVERLNGYIAALKDNHIPIREDYILYGDYKMHSGYDLTKKIITRDVTAILSCNQRMTLGCLQALNEAGVAVPGDMAVISFGRSDAFSALNIPLSHVYQPSPPIGEESARILLNRIEMGRKYRKVPGKNIIFSAECYLCGSEVYPVNRDR